MAVRHRDGTPSEDKDLETLVYRHLGGTDCIAALPPGVFQKLIDHVKGNPAFDVYEAYNDADVSAGPSAEATQMNPVPPPLRYGEGENDYVAITLEGGAVAIRDGNDPTGKVHQYSTEQWRALMAAVAGDGKDEKAKRKEWLTDSTGQTRSNPTGQQLHDRTIDFMGADQQATPENKAGR